MGEDMVVIGYDTNCVADLNDLLDKAQDWHFDYVCIPLVHPRQERDKEVSKRRLHPMTRSDFILTSGQWSTLVVGKVSGWMNLDSPCEARRLSSVMAFNEEIAWAAHLGVAAVLVEMPTTCSQTLGSSTSSLSVIANYARCINQSLQTTFYLNIWLSVSPSSEGWGCWNLVRSLCEAHQRLHVTVELPTDLPSIEYLKSWEGEPIKAIAIKTSVFTTNQRGYPVLSRRHQAFVSALLRFKPQFILSGRARHPNGYMVYMQYLEHLRQSLLSLTEGDKFEAMYLDVLQAPLQPLMDNLESQTYETFEQDPIKYDQYEKAIAKAIHVRKLASGCRLVTEDEIQKNSALALPILDIVLMVVGAGRGPLIRAALRAAESVGVRYKKIFAIEKNANAIITLRNIQQVENEWREVVIVAGDMRKWKAPEKADILVSELLGSWGDNELSPECLDGAQDFLVPGGISIPCDYTSYVAPITAHRLWRQVKIGGGDASIKSLETMYVVKLHNYNQITVEKPCFTFTHPVEQPADNSRYKTIKFDIPDKCVIHGFSGYFEATLFEEIKISIVPSSPYFSEGMFSWFPLFIPLREPLHIPGKGELEVSFWRCVTSGKVWYEWAVIEPSPTPLHNPSGRSHWIGL